MNINRGVISVKDDSKNLKMCHTVKQIHICVMEQMDHSCFLYTLRTPDKETAEILPNINSESSQLVPINQTENYQCYLFQAEDEAMVCIIFQCYQIQFYITELFRKIKYYTFYLFLE